MYQIVEAMYTLTTCTLCSSVYGKNFQIIPQFFFLSAYLMEICKTIQKLHLVVCGIGCIIFFLKPGF